MLVSTDADAGQALFLETCVHALLAALPGADGAEITPSLTAASKLEQARELLETRHADPPTISALARAIGTNEFTLKRSFKAAFGTTIYGYVRRHRMERAAERLDEGASARSLAARARLLPLATAEAPARHSRRAHGCATVRHEERSRIEIARTNGPGWSPYRAACGTCPGGG
jgi:AraC-like DNA-binding protein